MPTKSPSEVVSENVDRLRKQLGLNQEAIGQALGLKGPAAQRGASRRLSGQVDWNVNEISAVADLLGVSTGYLLQTHSEELAAK